MSLIVTKNLSKTFSGAGIFRRRPVPALKNINLKIEAGEIFGLVGASGSGKTTLARTLLYLEQPDSGEVSFDGTRLSTLSRRQMRMTIRPRMQIVFQDPHGALDPRMTIRQSMEEGLKNQSVPAAERAARVKTLLEQVGIPWSQAGWYPHEFSGGQKQRIVIARALVLRPAFLILDEPVSSLDVSIQAGIINLLLDLKKEYSLTYLFISHNIGLIGYLATAIGVLHNGELIETGPAEEIFSSPRHPHTRELVENPFISTTTRKES